MLRDLSPLRRDAAAGEQARAKRERAAKAKRREGRDPSLPHSQGFIHTSNRSIFSPSWCRRCLPSPNWSQIANLDGLGKALR